MKTILTSLVLLTACTPLPPITPAEKIIWIDTYKADQFYLPQIEWTKGVDCPYKTGTNAILMSCGYEGAGCSNGVQCDAGLFYGQVNVAYVVTSTSLHESALAHEMLHSHLLQSTGDGDAAHSRPEWNTILPAAVQALTEAGF
jgi:hypothetical protein